MLSTVKLEIEYTDYTLKQLERGDSNLWPVIRIYIESSDNSSDRLYISYDTAIPGFLEDQLEALIFAISEGRTAVCRIESMKLDGETYNTSSINCLLYAPNDESTISTNVITPTTHIYKKTIISEEDYDVVLPIDEITLEISEMLQELINSVHEYISYIEKNTSEQHRDSTGLDYYISRQRALLRDAEIAYEYYETHGSFAEFSYDTSLENFERLFFERNPRFPYVLGPIRDKWLERYALEHDIIEKLVGRIRTRSPDVAERQYRSLILDYDKVAERTLQALRKELDQKAIPALLLYVWDDHPMFGPEAVRIIGNVLSENKELVISRDWENVLQQLENRPEQSEHPEIRIATIEALGEIGEERSRPVIEAARDDPDADVRSTAERVLETL